MESQSASNNLLVISTDLIILGLLSLCVISCVQQILFTSAIISHNSGHLPVFYRT